MANKISQIKTINPRQIAFLSLLSSKKEEKYAHESLNNWQKDVQPNYNDFSLAQELTYGTLRRTLSLEYIASHAASKGKLKLKTKERILLHLAIYQLFFMNRIPHYAVVNEMVKLAKQYTGNIFSKFLNALLRKLIIHPISLPLGNTIQDLSSFYSYPTDLVQNLIQDYDLKKAIDIMGCLNKPPITMLRIRKGLEPSFSELNIIKTNLFQMAHLPGIVAIPQSFKPSEYYIQNITPVLLMEKLFHEKKTFSSVLDICAAPGGKTILLHDMFQETTICANDSSPQRIKILEENLGKYDIKASIRCSEASLYRSTKPFDLVLLDTPCSNSGVLNKRHEARFRLSEKKLDELHHIQLNLAKHALKLLSTGGELWYLTCSILKKENEAVIHSLLKNPSLKISKGPFTILPNKEGQDGGFACAIVKQ